MASRASCRRFWSRRGAPLPYKLDSRIVVIIHAVENMSLSKTEVSSPFLSFRAAGLPKKLTRISDRYKPCFSCHLNAGLTRRSEEEL
ncbi:hypothetical protein BpHYR1_002982 [Brachionus plicatilis]|uniref:Uncharacterized protein n=1 Tax=Brachionus plicatilis TaxID=10195 RepID=A0A3M7RUK3_BRAPC|nr:hypothetical protein BpHYR1_002982 [Brachionus plicatilis]